jgi:uncharacterized membrane protein
MGLLAPSPGASTLVRLRGFAMILLIVLVLLAVGFALAKLIALPFGGVGTGGGLLLGVIVVAVILGVLAVVGRRRQRKAIEQRAAAGAQRAK